MKKLTWDDLATLYDKAHSGSRPARTLPMETVFEWAEKKTDQFHMDKEGYLYLKEKT